MHKELYESRKDLTLADSLLIVSYVQGALASCYAALFAQQKQSSKVNENRGYRQSLRSVIENKTNPITDIFFLKY